MTIEDKQQEIVDEFSEIEDWFDRYAAIIDEGQKIVHIAENKKTPEHLIEGCQSSVWLDAELKDGKVYYSADVNTEIIKGIVSMLIGVLNGHTPDEVLGADLHFIDDIGLRENLSPTRSNGLLSVIKQMRMYALAFKALEKP